MLSEPLDPDSALAALPADLARMFDEARQPLAGRWVRQCSVEPHSARSAGAGIFAPYVAQASIVFASWAGERLPVLGGVLISPVGLGVLLAWRTGVALCRWDDRSLSD